MFGHLKVTKRIAQQEPKPQTSEQTTKPVPPSPLQDEMMSPQKKVITEEEFPSLSKETKLLLRQLRKQKASENAEPFPDPDALPKHLEFLVRLAVQLDSLINLFLLTGRTSTFTELRPMLQKSMGEPVRLADVQRVVGVCPELYCFSWKDGELVIEMMHPSGVTGILLRKAELDQREESVRNAMGRVCGEATPPKIFVTKSLYPPACSSAQKPDISGENTRDSVTEPPPAREYGGLKIPVAPLPPRPDEITPERLPEIITRLNKPDFTGLPSVHNSPLKKSGILQRLKDEGLISDLPKRPSPDLTDHQKTELLRERLVAKVREREQQRKKSEAYYQKLHKTVEFEDARKLCELIKFYFSSRKVRNGFVAKVVEFACKNHGKVKSFEEENAILQHVLRTLPHWVRVIDNKSGQIIHLEEDLPLEQVLDKLRQTYNKRT